MKQAISAYLAWKASYAMHAPEVYRLHLERFAEYVHKHFSKVKLDDVVKFQYFLKSKYSMANVAYTSMVLKNFFKFWASNGQKVIDPYLIRVPKFVPKSHTAVEPEDFETICAVTSENEFWELQKKVIVSLLWDTGMRIGELCAMDCSMIDSKKPMAMIITKKNNKQRWVKWSARTHDLLLKFVGTRICLNQQSHLFMAKEYGRRGRLSCRTAQRWVKELVDRAKIKKMITCHSFRHAKAHEILRKGGNPKHIQVVLGHSETNPISAFSYLRLNDREFERIADRFLR